MKKKVFYSFHFDNDVFRVQQIRNIGSIEGNAPCSVTEWETVKKGGQDAIKRWIDSTMKNCDCVIVLIGYQTAERPLVDYEIRNAWDTNKAIFGIFIDDLIDPRYSSASPLYGKSFRGANPFDNIPMTNGEKLSRYVTTYVPSVTDTYKSIAENISTWIETAMQQRR